MKPTLILQTSSANVLIAIVKAGNAFTKEIIHSGIIALAEPYFVFAGN